MNTLFFSILYRSIYVFFFGSSVQFMLTIFDSDPQVTNHPFEIVHHSHRASHLENEVPFISVSWAYVGLNWHTSIYIMGRLLGSELP